MRNGSIKGFDYGIRSLISEGNDAHACAFRDLSVSECTASGIYTGRGAVLESCRSHYNSGSRGIFAGNGSTLCNCSASRNSTTAVATTGNGGKGFGVGPGSTIQGCTAGENEGDGIRLDRDSAARDNTCFDNGYDVTGSSVGAGIHATGTGLFKFSLLDGGSAPVQAEADAFISRTTQNVAGFDLNVQGSGYVAAPSVSITGGGGSGATASTTISDGKVVSVSVVNPGSG